MISLFVRGIFKKTFCIFLGNRSVPSLYNMTGRDIMSRARDIVFQ